LISNNKIADLVKGTNYRVKCSNAPIYEPRYHIPRISESADNSNNHGCKSGSVLDKHWMCLSQDYFDSLGPYSSPPTASLLRSMARGTIRSFLQLCRGDHRRPLNSPGGLSGNQG